MVVSLAEVMKAVSKINRKQLVHAKSEDIRNGRLEAIGGPIDTQHMLTLSIVY